MNSANPNHLLVEANRHIQKQEYVEAKNILNNIKSIASHEGQALYGLAIISFKENDFERAISYLESALPLIPDQLKEKAYTLLGEALMQLKERSKAIDVFVKAYKLNKSSVPILLSLAQARKLNKDIPRTIKCYEAILKINPDHRGALEGLAMTYSESKMHEKAIPCFEKIVTANPNDKLALFNLGVTYQNAKQYPKALQVYETLADLSPVPTPVQRNLTKKMWQVKHKLKLTKGYFSEHGQDEFVYQNFFKYKDTGFFIDIGAYDGVDGSNTLFFERSLGWDGVCFEPSDIPFERLERLRKVPCIKAAVSDKDSDGEDFLMISDGFLQMGGLTKSYNQAILEEVVKKDPRSVLETVKVKTINLMNYLKNEKIRHVDFMSIDVEGAELSIIESIDFSQVNIEILSIENNVAMSDDLKDLMASKGYQRVSIIGSDEIYQKERL